MKTALAFLLFAAALHSEPPTAKISIGDWYVDEMRADDYSKITFGKLRAVGTDANPIFLVLRYHDGNFEVFISGKTFLGAQKISVSTKLDRAPIETSDCTLSGDKMGIFLPRAESFADRLARAKTLFVQYTPWHEPPVNLQFNLAGADAIVARVKGARYTK